MLIRRTSDPVYAGSPAVSINKISDRFLGRFFLRMVVRRPPPTLNGSAKKLYTDGNERWITQVAAANRPSPLEATRRNRLSTEERAEFESIFASLNGPRVENKDRLLGRLGALAARADAYDPLADEAAGAEKLTLRSDLFGVVWNAAAGLRRSGELLVLSRRIACPVVAIHGEYDPHPAAGVEKPLAAALEDFRFISLKRCGHTPWLERQAREEFFMILRRELAEK